MCRYRGAQWCRQEHSFADHRRDSGPHDRQCQDVRTGRRFLLELGSGFNPEFTGRENVFLNAAILGLSDAEIRARYDDIVAFADIGDFIDQPVRNYSSGMVMRLAFAVIAHVDADILIVDEALSVGDAYFTQKCMRFLRQFIATKTLFFVSHDVAAINSLCTHAIFLERGRIKSAGDPKQITELYLEDIFQAAQGEKPAGTAPSAFKRGLVLRPEEEDFRDARQDFLNKSTLRNDIQVFRFDPDAPAFGQGGACIERVVLMDQQKDLYAGALGAKSSPCVSIAGPDGP